MKHRSDGKEGLTALRGILGCTTYMQTHKHKHSQLNAQTIPSATPPRLFCCCYKPTSRHIPLWQHHMEHYGIWFPLMSLHLHLHAHAVAWTACSHRGSAALIWHSCVQFWWLAPCPSPLSSTSWRDRFSRWGYRHWFLETSMFDERLCPQAQCVTGGIH